MPQNYAWVFSGNAGLNFLPGPAPVSILKSCGTREGSASVADNFGSLLFYTADGTSGPSVYTKTGVIMPHGSSIVSYDTYSCTQAAAIVPVIGNPNQYYVFSLEQGGATVWYSSPVGCRLYYCIVDMTLNGGLGDVIASTLATPLDSGLCEKMTVVAGDNCDIWLLTHVKDAPFFKAYNISSAGISAPVVSTATGEIPTGPNAYKIGTIKVSPNRTMIANCVMNGAYSGGLDRLELLQFNPTTGIVSGCQVLNNFTNQYDAEFSPDNSKLYVHVMGSMVYQYDLSLLPSLPAVISSQFLVYTSPDWGGQMKLGPDNKIYIQTSVNYFDCINSPNLPGSSCNYTYHAIHSAGYGFISNNIGLPNMQIVANLTGTITTRTDTTVCALAATISGPSGSAWYSWSNGATTQFVTFTTSGIYWVISAHGCNLQIDTFNVIITPAALVPTVGTASFCAGSSATLTSPPGYTAHIWNTGATTTSINVTAAGNYWVADTNLSTCILQVDTFHVTAAPPILVPTVGTASFCAGSSATLTSPPGYTAHIWNTGATTTSINVTAAGNYWVTDTNLSTCILQVDTFHVTAAPPILVPTVGTASFCAGSSTTLTAPPGYTTHVWNTGATTTSINVTVAGTYWVSDTVFSTCTLFIDTLHVTAAPLTLIPAVTTTSFCTGSSTILTAPSGYTTHVWNTGATTTSINVTAAGNYWVADTNLSTCMLHIDTFHVSAAPLTLIPAVTTTSFCTGSSTILTAPSGYTTHVWNTGATTTSINVTTAGTYWVADTNLSTCMLHIDTFHVSAAPLTLIPAVTTTSFCTGSSTILTAPSGYTTHVWNTGATTTSINVTTAGTYWVADTNLSTCIQQVDTFHVTAAPPILAPTVGTASFCTGSSATLTSPPGYTAHVWNTGATTSSVNITTAGTYWVSDTVFSTCTLFTDTFHVTAIPLPVVALGKDTTICFGDSIALSSPMSVGSFLWSTSSTTFSITVQTSGIYYLTVTKQGCSNSDTIKINQLSAPSSIILGQDTILCKGEVFILSTNPNTALWSTGVVANSIAITDAGTYSANVTNACGSSVSFINVGFEPCDLDFPNAFTPNNDGRNDMARAIGYFSFFRDYTLGIYNRYGQRIFYTEDIYAGWDGTFNNVPQDLGTYYYTITYTLKGKHRMLKGDLTLIR